MYKHMNGTNMLFVDGHGGHNNIGYIVGNLTDEFELP
jgi:prepilin-type processing-associated H-X9-DG protein